MRVQNWLYLTKCDQYVYGYGGYLSFLYERKKRSENGYVSTVHVYEYKDCSSVVNVVIDIHVFIVI